MYKNTMSKVHPIVLSQEFNLIIGKNACYLNKSYLDLLFKLKKEEVLVAPFYLNVFKEGELIAMPLEINKDTYENLCL